MRRFIILAITLLVAVLSHAQEIKVAGHTVMSPADFGLTTSHRSWNAATAKSVTASKPRKIKEEYRMPTGKRSLCVNSGKEWIYTIKNADDETLRLTLRQYKDGYAFRYELDEAKPGETIKGEGTRFHIPAGANRWMQLYDGPGYEHFFPNCSDGVSPEEAHNKRAKTADGKTRWGYPALFEVADGRFMLISDSFSPTDYCGTFLINDDNDRDTYSVMPLSEDRIKEESTANSGKPAWQSAWRVVITGSLADVVESTLITDVAEPCKLPDTSWIIPAPSSWIYWAYNHGSQEYSLLKDYVDLAADMLWPYTLIDAEWDVMRGGDIKRLVQYAIGKGVKPMIWYNSTTAWTNGAPTPQGRLNDATKREAEFERIASWGVCGVKVDFFGDDTADMISYYRDLIVSAAKYKLLINFHGGTIPHGWQRTYPNVITCEAVYGAEWYNNNGTLTNKAARHNATLPFTRNVIGPMDYTPGTFTDSQHPHITTHAHELALTILFESGIQHMPDRPSAYRNLPTAVRELLSELPTAWDDTRLLAGYPGKSVVMARRKGSAWYVAGINGTDEPQTLSFNTNRLSLKQEYKKRQAKERQPQPIAITDGDTQTSFTIKNITKTRGDISIDCAPRGGFVLVLNPSYPQKKE